MAHDDDIAGVDTPARRLRAALELTDLAEKMLLQRLRREGSSHEEASARLIAWRAERGTHVDERWFVLRTAPRGE